MVKAAVLLTLLAWWPAALLRAQDAPPIATTALQGPELVGAEPATLTVTERNTVVTFTLTGHRLRGTRPARLYIRMPGLPWQEVYATPRKDSAFAVELVSQPFLARPGRVEFKVVLDALESNVLAVPVVR